jgi:hypothetical protein
MPLIWLVLGLLGFLVSGLTITALIAAHASISAIVGMAFIGLWMAAAALTSYKILRGDW